MAFARAVGAAALVGWLGCGESAGSDAQPTEPWRPTASLETARGQFFVAQVTGGDGVVVGGHNNPAPVLATERFDVATESWSPAGAQRGARASGLSAVQLSDGRILLGDHLGDDGVAVSEIYDAATEEWTPTAGFNRERSSYPMTLLDDGRVLAAGGIDWTTDTVTGWVEIYDPSTGRWEETGSLEQPRFGHRAVLLADGRVLVAGGAITASFDKTASAEVYDPATEQWEMVGSLSGPKSGQMVRLDSGEVMFIGGLGPDDLLDTTEIFDPAEETWRAGPSLMEPRRAHTITRLLDGRILVTGGRLSIPDGNGRTTAEIYDPQVGSWLPVGAMAQGRTEHGAALLPNGDVLVVGGATGFGWLSSAEIFRPD